jgi:hypothetical protein
MLKKKNIDIESIIRRLSKNKLNPKQIRKRLKPLLSKNLVPTVKVSYLKITYMLQILYLS